MQQWSQVLVLSLHIHNWFCRDHKWIFVLRTIVALGCLFGGLLGDQAQTLTGFRPLPELARLESWQAPVDGVAPAVLPDGIVTFTLTNLKEKDTRVVRLTRPVPLAEADAFNYWICFPAGSDGYGVSLTPLFASHQA